MMAKMKSSKDIVAIKVLRKAFLLKRGRRTVKHAISEKQVLQAWADAPEVRCHQPCCPLIIRELRCSRPLDGLRTSPARLALD